MFRKILVPFDGSQIASQVFPQVAELAKTCNSQLTLIYVYHTDEVWGGTPGMLAEVSAKARNACETFLSQAAKELLEQGVKTDWVCIEGVPARGIIYYADQNEMDLIAMATHGRGEVAWVLGSVAEQVLTHATVPVLLFRAIKTQPPQMKEPFSIPVRYL